MKGIKFKSFEEYAKYIEENASGKVQETKAVKAKTAKKKETAKAKASSKKKKENYATKTNVGKAGNTLEDVTTFSGYRGLSLDRKNEWLKLHGVKLITTGVYNQKQNALYVNQVNPLTGLKIAIPCGQKFGLKDSITVTVRLMPKNVPPSPKHLFDFVVLGSYVDKTKSEHSNNPEKIPVQAGTSQYKSDDILKWLDWDKLDMIEDYRKIHFDDFVTMSDHNPCVKHKHDIEPINALVFVLRKSGTVTTKTIPASYCRTCSKYYISKWQYEDICEHGVPLFRKIIEKKGLHQGTTGFFNNLNAESKLHSNGYNVSSSEDLSDAQRQIILSLLMESGVCEREEIKSHLSWLISSREGQDSMQNAVAKWKKDRKFVASYKMGDCRLVGIKLLRYKG